MSDSEDTSKVTKTLLNKSWVAISAGACLVAAAITLTDDPISPEEQGARDKIHALTYQMKDRTMEHAGNTSDNSRGWSGYNPDEGVQITVDLIRDYYDDDIAAMQALKFLHDENIMLHATSMETTGEGVRAVFYNNIAEDERILIVRKQEFLNPTRLNGDEDFPEALKTLIGDMQSGDVLQQDGAHVVFEDKFTKENSYVQRKFLPDIHDLDGVDILAIDGVKTTKVTSMNGAWVNPILDDPAP